MSAKNTILMYESNGNVTHRFCTEGEANNTMDKASVEGKGCSAFISDAFDAELIYNASPELREHVREIKAKILCDMMMRDAMDRNGIPQNAELRNAIRKTIQECQLA